MQNLITALSIPGLGPETANTTPGVELGDGSFSDAFVDAAPVTELEPAPDATTPVDIVVPFPWPLIVLQKPAYLPATDTALSVDPTATQEASDVGRSVTALSLGMGQIAATVTSPDLQTERVPASLTWLALDTLIEGEKGSSVGATELASGKADNSESRFSLDEMAGQLASQPPLAETVTDLQSHDDKRAKSDPTRIVVDPATNDADAVTQQTSDAPLRITNSSEPTVGSELPLTWNLDLSELTGGPVDRLSNKPTSSKGSADLEQRAIAQLKPLSWLMDGTDAKDLEVPTDVSSTDSAGEVGSAKLAADPSATLASIQEQLPLQDADTDQRAPFVSFWERYFSDPAIPAAELGLRAATATAPTVATAMPGPLVVPFLAETLGETVTKSFPAEPPASDTVASPVPDLQYVLAPQTMATAPPAPSEGVFGMESSDLVILEWEDDLSLSDSAAEFLQSPGQTQSTRSALGSLALALPALPIPQIASQLASALIRNANSITELTLAPEELGRVKLRMEPDAANPDRLLILISVERPETLDLFRRHAGELAEAIRNAGYAGADIGFGQSGRDGGSEQRGGSSHSEPGLPFEEGSHVEAIRMLPVGASLNLRL
jgi:hypothetical protein